MAETAVAARTAQWYAGRYPQSRESDSDIREFLKLVVYDAPPMLALARPPNESPRDLGSIALPQGFGGLELPEELYEMLGVLGV